jgi:hypothetical protein
MGDVILIILTLFILFRIVVHCRRTIKDGNKLGGFAYGLLIPVVLFTAYILFFNR